jgi:integrase
MSRVRDLWFAEVPVRDAEGKLVRQDDGRVLKEKRKTAKHPDRGGNKDAKRWLAVWLDPDGKEVTQAFAKKKAAEDYAKKMEGDAERGDYIAKGAGREKVGDLAVKWISFRDVGGPSRERYESVYRNQVEPAFGRRSVKGVQPSEVLAWLRSPEIASMSGTVRLAAYMILAGAFDLAVADKMRRDNPVRSDIIAVPKADDMARSLWPVERVWAVIDQHPEEYRAIPVVAAGLGLRQGCALGLAEDDIDWDAERVTVRRQVARIGGRYYFKLPKGNKERTVPLPRGVAAVLRAYIEAYPPEPYSLPWMNKDGKPAKEPHECRLLFRWHGDARRNRGRHISAPAYDARVWKPALSRAGIAPEPARDKWGVLRYSSGSRENGMHALRHFYSTALGDGGVSPAGVTAFMGHSPKALPVTFRVYGHVTEETFEQARAAVDQRLFRIRPAQSPGTVTELRAAR